MSLKKVVLKVTTAADGSATATSTNWVMGWCAGITYIPGTIDTGATITVTAEGPMSTALLTKASAGTSNARFMPLITSNQVNDGSASTGYTQYPLIDGKIKLVVASGASTKTGSIIVYYFD